MSYQVWSVVFGEQPSASKWNILGTNDAEFNSLIQRNSTGLNTLDSNGNEIIKGAAVASAVNEVTVTNAAAASAPIMEATGGDTNIHLVVRGKGNGLLKTSVLRQDNTTNSYKHNSVILTGWGLVAYNTGAANVTDTITFGITFADRPIVVGVFGGDHASATTYGSGGNLVEGLLNFKIHTITTTTAVAQVHKTSGGNFVAGNGFYQWMAVGELA